MAIYHSSVHVLRDSRKLWIQSKRNSPVSSAHLHLDLIEEQPANCSIEMDSDVELLGTLSQDLEQFVCGSDGSPMSAPHTPSTSVKKESAAVRDSIESTPSDHSSRCSSPCEAYQEPVACPGSRSERIHRCSCSGEGMETMLQYKNKVAWALRHGLEVIL